MVQHSLGMKGKVDLRSGSGGGNIKDLEVLGTKEVVVRRKSRRRKHQLTYMLIAFISGT